jgi:DNA-binding MarR family transcriptional regulator
MSSQAQTPLRRRDDGEIDSVDRLPLPGLMGEVKEAAVEELHRQLAARGFDKIRPAHGCVFRFVSREGMQLTELAQLAGLSKQSIGEFVVDLEQLGYIERIPHPSDRRAKLIRLTKRGMEAQAAAQEIFADIERSWAEQVGERRVAALRETLERIQELERSPSAVPA